MSLKFLSQNFRKLVFLMSMFFVILASAQNQKTVSGTVMADGSPLPGATIVAKNSKIGTATDFDGKFSLSVPASTTTIVVSYLGYITQEVVITPSEMTITLIEESNTLDEVVINVGYGSQKKSVVTGAISKISAKELDASPNNGRIEQALQGKTSGVYIASNAGQPGSSSTIRVRGVTSFNGYGGNNVLWVVDGVAISDDIGFLNQSDIESIEVLKDAASLAIYGARSASGVILVTTKKGKQGGFKIGYTGSYGYSSPAKVLDLLNATQYAALMNERSIADGGSPVYTNLSLYGKGTDWQKAIFNNDATRYNHEVNLSGGNENSNFYLSFGAQNQEGIVLSEISNYNKKSIRLNSNHKLFKFLTIGQNLGYSHQKSVGIGNTNNEFGGPLSSAINLDPITPIVVTDPIIANGSPYDSTPYEVLDENGNPYGISSVVGQEMSNPLAYTKTRLGQYSFGDDIVGNVYLEFSPIEGLKFKSTLGSKLAFWGGQGFTPMYYLNSSTSNLRNNISRSQNRIFAWNIENIVTYSKQFGNHDFTVLLGQGAYEDDNPIGLSVTHSELSTNDYRDASFNDGTVVSLNKTGYSWTVEPHRVSSLFSRVNYNYGEKYLFTGIIRRDGSSNFGSNYKYGIFPSFSLGWVVSKETFWKENNIVNQFKLRGGYGVTGNDRIGKFSYLSTIGGGRNYTLGIDQLIIAGASPNAPANPDLKWEETRQTNVGFETRLFNDFNITFDWFNKETVGILQNIVIPGYLGLDNPKANVADMENTGIEIEMGYKKRFNEVNFSANANFSTLKNEVTFLGNGIEFISSGAGFQSMGDINRTEIGESYNYFWGYQTDGIFQNVAEVNAYTNSTGGLIQPNAKPGDFRWVDTDGNGTISPADRTNLGSPLPKYTFGLTLNADYKGFDVMVLTQGMAGNKIFQGLRRLDILNSNYQTVALSRWTGEGTSNDYPRLTNLDPNGNFGKMSDFYLQKGDFLRFKVVQFGYTLPKTIIEKIGAEKVRLFVTGENLLTLTKYTGYDPEIGGDVSGIDKGFYPQARTFLFGVNFQF